MAPFEVQILSDLHLETPASAYELYDFPKTAPNLALLGDIGLCAQPGLFEFLSRQLSRYDRVFFLLGNHEAYASSYPSAIQHSRAFEQECHRRRAEDRNLGEFVFLGQRRYDVDDTVTVLGTTLFSRIPPEAREAVGAGLNDFYQIEGWTPSLHDAAHADDVAWLDAQVQHIERMEPWRRVLIVTHHSPTVSEKANNPVHKGSAISSGFVSDLRLHRCWESARVRMWAFGHTHYNFDEDSMPGGGRVVSNQKGYYFKLQPGFDAARVYVV